MINYILFFFPLLLKSFDKNFEDWGMNPSIVTTLFIQCGASPWNPRASKRDTVTHTDLTVRVCFFSVVTQDETSSLSSFAIKGQPLPGRAPLEEATFPSANVLNQMYFMALYFYEDFYDLFYLFCWLFVMAFYQKKPFI